MDFSRQKYNVWHQPPQNCRRRRQNFRRIWQPTVQENAKVTKFCLIVSKETIFKICPKYLNFCRSKEVAPKVAKVFFFGPMANEVACTIPEKIGEMWQQWLEMGNRWDRAGSAMATMWLTKGAANKWGWLRLLSRSKSLAIQNQQNTSHVEP